MMLSSQLILDEIGIAGQKKVKAPRVAVIGCGGLGCPGLPGLQLHLQEIPRNKGVVIHCLSGKRSTQALSLPQQEFGFENPYNLTGGLSAWRGVDFR
jgi:rhodanese-related sulfurtransferase